VAHIDLHFAVRLFIIGIALIYVLAPLLSMGGKTN